jgi:hypothetical protein
MTDKKEGPPTWGEDIFTLVTARQLGSQQLVEHAEAQIERRYRLEMREKFQRDPRVRQALIESAECLLSEGTYDSVRGLMVDVLRAGTEEVFDRVLHELLEELDVMHKREPSAYLVSHQDGKVLMPITDKDVYTPPPYVGEDGITRPAKPILHPAISAPLTMLAFEQGRKNEAITRAVAAGASAAVEHLVMGPDAILERARVLLRTQGVTVEPLENGTPATIEVGREHVDDMLQAPNYNFHRSQMYGSLLAKKVLNLLRGQGRCDLKSAILKKGSKEQWYEITLDWAAT